MFIFTEQDQMPRFNIAIAGAGPAGVFAAIFAAENPNNSITIYEKSDPLKTLLPTGGGRCNLAHFEFDLKALAANFPRGEKFLYSVLSKFSTADTIEFFEKIGVKTYTQEDMRVFPQCNSSQEVRNALLKRLNTAKNIKIVKSIVKSVKKSGAKFIVETSNGENACDAVILATGGRGAGHEIARGLGHTVVELRPALCGLKIQEEFLTELAGLSIKNVRASVPAAKIRDLSGDLLFTHNGISGPLVFKISSLCAYCDYSKNAPLEVIFNISGQNFEEFDKFFSKILNNEAKKDISNVLCNFVPKRFCDLILGHESIAHNKKSGQLNKTERQKLSKALTELKLNVTAPLKGGEIVTAGGVCLNEVNSKTMESKIVKNLYFCGELLDIDGLCGGFNLQNCWSTGFVAGSALKHQI